ncbi:diaminopimelate epimerase [Rhodococcus sp. X156]|uniref:diaminopimelate epimerase n=1 Tax=Rhodococcus sp. X156 TaxID=2499145 RepID=UPI000FD8167D|nr:diaminopimelate epimerase [Rhodococcus sp. X156]
MDFAKGHGTQNDFVVLPDVDGMLDLTAKQVTALCDRRRGLGADGVLRVVRAGALEEPLAEGVCADDWFMDYRNADGSIAEMCGNGVRVFAHYLRATGLEPRDEFVVGTRAGARPVVVHAGDGAFGEVTVDMGPARVLGGGTAALAGELFGGVAVDLGNPHLACVTDRDLSTFDLSTQPGFDATLFPHGVNIELVSPLAGGEVHMRVHERGVGETRSCGTGTVAAAVAALKVAGASTGDVAVNVLGGQVRVSISEHTSHLRGPSVLLAHGSIDPHWWAAPA